MSALEDRVLELEHWKMSHELEHKTLRTNLEKEIRSKVESDVAAASRHFDDELRKQRRTLEEVTAETKAQTPILERSAKRLAASSKERNSRKAEERVYRTWIKRAAGVAIAIELVARIVVPLLHH